MCESALVVGTDISLIQRYWIQTNCQRSRPHRPLSGYTVVGEDVAGEEGARRLAHGY